MKEDYTDLVARFADFVIKDIRDRYGPEHTPLFVDGLDLKTRAPLKYPHTFRGHPGGTLCNVAFQQNWFRTLVSLSHATGEMKYKETAIESFRFFIDRLQHPVSGLLPWGGHMYYDLLTEKVVGHQHELKYVYPFYELMWEISPDATIRFIRGFWHAHMLDWSTMIFNRHGPFEGGSTNGQLSFLNTGSDLILAAAFLQTATGKWSREHFNWAWRLVKRYADARSPKTGLGPYQITERWRKDARRLFGDDYSELNITPYGNRYAYLDFILLHVSEMLGEKGGDFRRWAVEDLKTYPKYGYDQETDGFYAMLCTGTGRRLTPADFKDPTATYFARERHYTKKGPEFLAQLLRSYAYGYEITGVKELLVTSELINTLLHLDDAYARAKITSDGEVAGTLIQGLLDLYESTSEKRYLENAQQVADESIRNLLRDDGLFVRRQGEDICWINQRFPLALLRLQSVLSKSQKTCVPDICGTSGRTYVK